VGSFLTAHVDEMQTKLDFTPTSAIEAKEHSCFLQALPAHTIYVLNVH
jgi:hypothetical protein